MNEKSDKPAKQSAEPDPSAAQDQPQYREVSQEELKQILAAQQKWLQSDGKEGQRAHLIGANLQQANLDDANLQEAFLWGANLQGAKLFLANLQKADLSEANLQKAGLRKANLQWAFLRKANLQQANLDDANLQEAFLGEANLQGADLRVANLQGADLREAKGLTASQIKEADNWQLAFYSDDFLKELGLPADHNETVKQKLAEMEDEKAKIATQP